MADKRTYNEKQHDKAGGLRGGTAAGSKDARTQPQDPPARTTWRRRNS